MYVIELDWESIERKITHGLEAWVMLDEWDTFIDAEFTCARSWCGLRCVGG